MKLRGNEFGNIFVASGGMNFFGEGWEYDRYYKRFIPGYTMDGVKKIAKTSTLPPRKGFMPLKENLQPVEFRPKCIYVDFLRCFMLNAVGLSGPGLSALINMGIWQKMMESFVISIMAVGATLEERIVEIQGSANLLKKLLPELKVPIAIELNVSCPNTGHNTKKLIEEALIFLEILNDLGIPIIIKLNLLVSTKTAYEIYKSALCDGISIPNTYPTNELPDTIKMQLFKNGISPLKEYGGGGYSGPYQTPEVAYWIHRARAAHIDIPIIAGSIYKKEDVRTMKLAGASAIAIGAVKVLRPWRLRGIINEANKQFGGNK